jgi:hypothetical protein
MYSAMSTVDAPMADERPPSSKSAAQPARHANAVTLRASVLYVGAIAREHSTRAGAASTG